MGDFEVAHCQTHIEDIRFAPAIEVVRRLLAEGALIRASDLVAIERARGVLPGSEFLPDPYEVARHADALLLTEWKDYRELDWKRIHSEMAISTGPKGRRSAIRKPIIEALFAVLHRGATNQLRGRTFAELIAIRLVRQALEGDVQAIKEILNRTEGRVPQARLEQPQGQEIEVKIVHIGGKEAFDRARREFEEANGKNENYKTN